MGFRIRKSIKLLPGVRVNLGAKSGPSISIGGKGVTTNYSSRGTRTTVSIPGTGISWSSTTSSSKGSRKPAPPTPAPKRVTSSAPSSPSVRISVTTTASPPAAAAAPAPAGYVPVGKIPAHMYYPRSANTRLANGDTEDAHIDMSSMLPYAPGYVAPAAPRPIGFIGRAWLGIFALFSFATLCTGEVFLAIFIAWMGVLPVGAMRTRVVRRWSHYLLIGLALFLAFGFSTSYRRGQEERAQAAAIAAARAAAQAAKTADEHAPRVLDAGRKPDAKR